MKKYINKLLLSLALVGLFTSSTFAVDQVNTFTGATISNIISGPIHLTSLEVVNNHPTSSVGVWIYDSPSATNRYTSAAFPTFSTYVTNLITTATNYQNIVFTYTNSVLYTYTNAVAASTNNNYRLLKYISVASGDSSTWNPVNGVYLSFGLTATNNATNITINTSFSNIH